MKKSPRLKFFKVEESGVTPSDVAFVPTKPDEPNKRGFALSPDRREKLEDMMRKENVRAKKDKLSLMLTQKMQNKFSGKNGAIIKAAINDFLDKHQQINPEDIAKLQEDIKEAIKNAPKLPKVKPGDAKNAGGGPESSGATSADAKSSSFAEEDIAVKESKFVDQVGNQNAEWKIVMALQLAEKDLIEDVKLAKAKLKNAAYKKCLDEQKAIVEAQKYKEKILDRDAVAKVQEADVAKFNEDNLKKQELIKQKMLRELMIQKEQVALNKSRREAEAKAIEDYAQQKIKEFAEAIALEKKKKDEKMLQLKENGKKVKLENDELLKIKAQMKIQEGLENIRMQKEANERAEKVERERDAAFQARLAAMAVMAEKFENDGAGKAAKEAKIKEEQIMIKQQILAEEKAKAHERKKAQDARQREIDATAVNNKLIAEREAIRQRELEENERIAQEYKQNKENYQKSIEDKSKKMKEDQVKYRNAINTQIQAQGKVDTKLEQMSPREKIINMNSLKKVVADPELYSRVVHKARMMGVAL